MFFFIFYAPNGLKNNFRHWHDKGSAICAAYSCDLNKNDSDDTEVKLHSECSGSLVLPNEFREIVIFYILGKEEETQLEVTNLPSLSLPVVRKMNLCSSEFLTLFFKNMEPRSQSKMCCNTNRRKDELHLYAASSHIPTSLPYLYLYICVSVCLAYYYYISLCFCNLTFLSNVIFTKSDVKPVASLLYPLPEITLISSSTSAVVVVWNFLYNINCCKWNKWI